MSRSFDTTEESEAYELGQRDGADAALELVAELVAECERCGVVDIARMVRAMKVGRDTMS